jgi:hypothetical protein
MTILPVEFTSVAWKRQGRADGPTAPDGASLPTNAAPGRL